MSTSDSVLTWQEVISRLLAESPDATVQVAIADIEHPVDGGMQRCPATAGDQIEYRAVVDQQTLCRVVQLGAWFQASLFRLPVPSNPPQPLATAPRPLPVATRVLESRAPAGIPPEAYGFAIAGTTLLGAIIGGLIDGGKGAAVGAVAGMGTGLVAVGVSTAVTSPETSYAAQSMFMHLALPALAGPSVSKVIRLSPPSRPALPPGRTTSTALPVPRPRTGPGKKKK